MHTCRILAAACVLAWAACASAQVRDSIKYGKNLYKSGVIVTAENWDKVVYKATEEGPAETIPADEVTEIGYGDTPSSFRMAQSFVQRRSFDEALKQFQAAAADTSARRFWLGQHANYHMGRLLYRLGGLDKANYEAALAAYAEVEKAAPQGRFVPPARVGIGMCHLQMGRTQEAEKVFQSLVTGDFGPKWAYRGRLGLVRVEAADAKNAPKAIEKAQKLVEEAREADLRLEAKLVLADVYKAAAKYQEARKAFDEVASAAPEEDILTKAAAYNGAGDCYRAEKDVENAKWAYLRVRCVYFEEPDQTPRAMEGLAWAFKQIRDTKRLHEIVEQIKKEYPNSIYAARAQEMLK